MRVIRGFTLIELLVVIAIIGVLSSVVLVAVADIRENSKAAAAQVELKEIERAIVIAQGEERQALRWITNSNCSDCSCRATRLDGLSDMRNIPDTDLCYTRWQSALQNILAGTGGVVSGLNLLRDPWGSPYMLDENEEEATPCRKDELRSAGPDGVRGSGDDIVVIIPNTRPPCI